MFNQFGQVESSNSTLAPFDNQEAENYPDVFQLSEDQTQMIQDLDLSQYTFKREHFYNYNNKEEEGFNYNLGGEDGYNNPYFVSEFSQPTSNLGEGESWGEAGSSQYYDQAGPVSL